MRKDHLLSISISGYRTSVENVKLSPLFLHNAFSDDPSLSPNQLAMRIACSTEATLIHKEDVTPLMNCTVFVLFTPLLMVLPMVIFQRHAAFWTDAILVIRCSCFLIAATTNLSKTSTYGMEGFPMVRNDSFIDSELFTYIGQTTPLLQLFRSFFRCEVVQIYLTIFSTDSASAFPTLQWPTRLLNALDRSPIVHYHVISRSNSIIGLGVEKKVPRRDIYKMYKSIPDKNLHKENGTWRRSNFKLYPSYKESDIVNFSKFQRIKWAGPVARMEEDPTTKKVFNAQPTGTRRKGMPNLRWTDDLLREFLVLRT
ncbi:uncharacterized protein TNCV_1882091 [Trichonephila clavipes]|nr:uncharacterized protein TNCV_1882091 [Trichonephila clavipes]